MGGIRAKVTSLIKPNYQPSRFPSQSPIFVTDLAKAKF